MIDETAPKVLIAQPAATPIAPASGKACANCGAPMLGAFCYACGQPAQGMIRHLASVLSDAADTVFNIDSRVFRSIVPLYFRPGYLTEEYFAGRRTRYVTPFRLFFFLCIISFLAIQASLNIGAIHLDLGNADSLDQATTVAEVQQRRDRALAGLATARQATILTPAASAQSDAAVAKVRSKADKQLAYLNSRADATANGQVPPKDPSADDGILDMGGKAWNPVANPIRVAWLPAFANAKLNELVAHAKKNIIRARKDQSQLVAGLFSVSPQTLFVLMPLFAVLLKIVYLLKRRLYMEHLLVALHSHAFICMSLLLFALVQLLLGWATTDALWALPLLRLIRGAIWTWLPIYLFLMQKKVYRQGWFMTTFKYGLVGLCYLVILSLGLAGALVASLTLA